jgi:2'-5' RNA ligase
MRLFFAIPVSRTIRDLVSESLDNSGLGDPPWRWIPPANYHLTLKFLGETDEKLIPDVERAARSTTGMIEPFTILFGPFGGFPSLRRPRVLFYGIERGMSELKGLAGKLEGNLEHLGFEKERRPFKAHLTLARIKRPVPAHIRERLGSVPALPSDARQVVDRFVLMRSHLGKRGAMYEELSSYPLGAEP